MGRGGRNAKNMGSFIWRNIDRRRISYWMMKIRKRSGRRTIRRRIRNSIIQILIQILIQLLIKKNTL